MLNYVVLVGTGLAFGFAAGWLMRGERRSAGGGRRPAVRSGATRDTMRRVGDLTRDVAADVDRHKFVMRRINDELQALKTPDATSAAQAIARLIESNEQVQHQLDSAQQKLEHQAREIESHATAARTDALTRLANRRAFDDAMHSVHCNWVRSERPATLMMIDIDHFKMLNDTYGHQAGDEVLKGVSRVLEDRIGRDYVVARFGGEEFAVVFGDATIADIVEMAEQTREAVGAGRFEFDGIDLRVTISAGLAQFQQDESVASLISRADNGLYASKEHGRNCGHFHDGRRCVALTDLIRLASNTNSESETADVDEFGLANRACFCENVAARLSQCRAAKVSLSLLLLHVDDLDEVRRRGGDDNVRATLRAVSLATKSLMREVDTVGRFDGNSLAILLPGCAVRGGIKVAERLRTAVSQSHLPKRYPQRRFTISCAVVEATRGEDQQQLVRRASYLLDSGRTRARNCVCIDDGGESRLVSAGHVGLIPGTQDVDLGD